MCGIALCILGPTANAAHAQANEAANGATDIVIVAADNRQQEDAEKTGTLAQTGAIGPLPAGMLATLFGTICMGIEWTLRK